MTSDLIGRLAMLRCTCNLLPRTLPLANLSVVSVWTLGQQAFRPGGAPYGPCPGLRERTRGSETRALPKPNPPRRSRRELLSIFAHELVQTVELSTRHSVLTDHPAPRIRVLFPPGAYGVNTSPSTADPPECLAHMHNSSALIVLLRTSCYLDSSQRYLYKLKGALKGEEERVECTCPNPLAVDTNKTFKFFHGRRATAGRSCLFLLPLDTYKHDISHGKCATAERSFLILKMLASKGYKIRVPRTTRGKFDPHRES